MKHRIKYYSNSNLLTGWNLKEIEEVIENQLKEDMMSDQITIKEYKDPFKG